MVKRFTDADTLLYSTGYGINSRTSDLRFSLWLFAFSFFEDFSITFAVATVASDIHAPFAPLAAHWIADLRTGTGLAWSIVHDFSFPLFLAHTFVLCCHKLVFGFAAYRGI